MKKKKYFWFGCGLLILVLLAIILFWKNTVKNSPIPPKATQATQSTIADMTATQQVSATLTPVSTQTLTSMQAPIYSFDDPEWWSHSVFYEIFVRSFYDSDGDGIGDFNGITQKLDYLNDGNPQTSTDLGINAIWLMPIFPSPSYHGYDVTDYMTVNPQYGTLEEFQNLISEAHKRGIHVVLDFVINHTSDQNPWFVAAQDPSSEYHDWYIWSQTDPGYAGPWNEQVWNKASNGLYYYSVFWSGMPDLNYRNSAVTDQIEKIAKYWLIDMNVDGFRVDGARHLIEDGKTQVNTAETMDWFAKFREMYKSWKPIAMTVGEIWDSSYITTKYLESSSFDMVFDFDLSSALITTIGMGDGNALSSAISSEVELYAGKGMGTFLSNHDMNRVMSQFGNNEKLAGHAATVLLTIPGTPFIYYGEEIGMQGEKPDEQIRTPMQWDSSDNAGFTAGVPWETLNFSYKTFNVADEKMRLDSLLNLYTQLIQLRGRHPALINGDYLPVQSNTSLYASLRQTGEEKILTLVNLQGKEVDQPQFNASGCNLEGKYELQPLLGDASLATDVVFSADSTGCTFTLNVQMPADANLIYQLIKVQ